MLQLCQPSSDSSGGMPVSLTADGSGLVYRVQEEDTSLQVGNQAYKISFILV